MVAVPLASAETFDTPPTGNFHWKAYDYNASGKALRSRQPFVVTEGSDGGIGFDFLFTPDTALLITAHPSYRGDLLGDLSSDTMITAKVGVTVTTNTVFTYYGEPDACDGGVNKANVRFFFQTQTTGPFSETDYWWSNSATSHAYLRDLKASGDMTITNTFSGAEWSDFYGHLGDDPAYAAAFDAALHNVKAIGLSFGGGCFFENGVGIDPNSGGSGYLRVMDFSVDPPGVIDPDAIVVPSLLLAPFLDPTLIEIP